MKATAVGALGAILVTSLLLAGCGHKGNLYPPETSSLVSSALVQ